MKNIFPKGAGDGTHRGPADWYEDVKEAIWQAIQNESEPWTTGWMGCKHEILSTKIGWDGSTYILEASVSDDFDTPGIGVIKVTPAPGRATEHILNVVEDGLRQAHNTALEDQSDNRNYNGFSIHRPGQAATWVETYIQQRNNGWNMNEPPGDCYHQWGFQGECELPAETKEKMEDVIQDWDYDENADGVEIDGYIVRAWK